MTRAIGAGGGRWQRSPCPTGFELRPLRHDRDAAQGEDGKRHVWRIVGEDKADAAHGTISHVSPMAMAMFGKLVGEEAGVNGKAWEIVKLG